MTHPVEPHEIEAAGNGDIEDWEDVPFRWIGIVFLGALLAIPLSVFIIAKLAGVI